MAISPQIPKYNGRISRRHKLSFDVLSDPGNVVASAFGLTFAFSEAMKEVYSETLKISLPKYNGDESWELPMPARFVISPDGKIVDAEADPDYTQRPEPSATLAVLSSLSE